MNEPAELLLGVAVIVDQPLISLRLLNCVEVLALDILDQRDFQRLLVAEIADDGGDFVQPRPLGRAPAALAGDDLEAVAMRTDDDRLDDAARPDRGGELDQRLFLEDPPRLAGMRLDAGDRDHLHAAGAAAFDAGAADRRFDRDLAKEGRKPPPEARRAFPAGDRIAHAASFVRAGNLAISSRAKAI